MVLLVIVMNGMEKRQTHVLLKYLFLSFKACFITGFLGHKELLCCQSPTTEVVPYNEHHSMAATSFMKTESFFSAVFAYKSTTYVDGNTIVHEEELYAERVEQQRAAIGYGYDRY